MIRINGSGEFVQEIVSGCSSVEMVLYYHNTAKKVNTSSGNTSSSILHFSDQSLSVCSYNCARPWPQKVGSKLVSVVKILHVVTWNFGGSTLDFPLS